MITFLGPNHCQLRGIPSTDRVIHSLEGLLEAAYSTRVEHAGIKARVAELNRWSQVIAEQFGQALPEELQDFWAAYSGWFAMYAVGPLLANWQLVREVLAETQETTARILECWRAHPWWSGRYQIAPALCDELVAHGLTYSLHPGAILRKLRNPVLHFAAERQRRQALREEVAAAFQATRQPHTVTLTGAALWLSVGASSADLMARLIPTLERDYDIASQVLDFHYYQSAEACHRHGLLARDIMTYASEEALQRAARNARSSSWWAAFQRQAVTLPCRSELPPALYQALHDRMRLVLYRDAALWQLWGEAACQALDDYAPAVVLTFHVYGPVVMPLLVEAMRRGIPSLCLQHGVIGPRYLSIPCPRYAEILVFGDYSRNIMLQTCPEDTIVTATGHCLYDELQTPMKSLRPEVAGLKAGVRGLVVLCSQFNEAIYYDPEHWWIGEIARTCRELGVRLAIKTHPSDPPINVTRYRGLEQPGDDGVIVIPHGEIPLDELLAACDVMVTRDSTVVFEANLLDKPVLTVNLSHWDEELPYAATGGALGVYHFADIAPALNRVLFDPFTRERLAATRAEFLRLHCGSRDGQATARICATIAAWARNERRPGETLS